MSLFFKQLTQGWQLVLANRKKRFYSLVKIEIHMGRGGLETMKVENYKFQIEVLVPPFSNHVALEISLL